MATSVQYLGYLIDTEGIQSTQTKVKAMKDAHASKNVFEFKVYLGMLTY